MFGGGESGGGETVRSDVAPFSFDRGFPWLDLRLPSCLLNYKQLGRGVEVRLDVASFSVQTSYGIDV